MQSFTSIMLFADRNMIKHFLGFPFYAETTIFFNPFFIILLCPLLSRLWPWLHYKHKDPSTPVKFTGGLFMMSMGFIFLAFGIRWFNVDGMISPWWLCASYFMMTVGELLLSPIGLSMVTRLAPVHLRGTMMGVWFLTQSAAFAIGGTLATWASVPDGASAQESIVIYSHAFLKYGALAGIVTLISLAFIPFIKRLIDIPDEVIKTPKY
jgi:POT family proton-dependent oligopeptide transporter